MSDDQNLVGRRDELADFLAAVGALPSGAGAAIAYLGGPGSGKSSLLDGMAAAARSAGGVAVLRAQGTRPAALSGLADRVAGLAEHVVVVLDDIHRIPDDAAPLLARLLELTTTRTVLLVVAYRPRQLGLAAAAAMSDAHFRVRSWQLRPLSLDDARHVLGDRANLVDIHRLAGGNPRYLRLIADPEDAGWAAHLAELAALSPPELAVAQAAAVLGGPSTPALLMAVSALDLSAAPAALDGLVAADVLRPAEPTQLMAFRHATLAAATYRTISVSQRSALHLRADRELARLGAPAVARAPHVVNATDPTHPELYRTLTAGAQQALVTDPGAAEGWLEATGIMLGPDDPRWHPTQLMLAQARLRLGRLADSRATLSALMTGSAPADAETTIRAGRVERLLGRYAEAEALVRVGLAGTDAPVTRLAGFVELAGIASDNGEFADADRLACEAARLGRELEDGLLESAAWGEAGWARVCAGDFPGAQVAVSRCARVIDAISDAEALRDLECLCRLGQTELLLENLSDARRHLGRGLALARSAGHQHPMLCLLRTLAEVDLHRGRLDSASGLLDEVEPLVAAETGIVAVQTLAAAVRAQTSLWKESTTETAGIVAALERVLDRAADAGPARTWLESAQSALAEVLLFAGEAERAAGMLLAAGGGALLRHVSPARRVRWWELLTMAALAKSDVNQADRYASLAEAAVRRASTAGRRGFAFRARALVARAGADTAEAVTAGDLAAAAFASADMLLDLGRTHVIVAAACLDADRADGARERLDAAAELARRCAASRLADQVVEQVARLERSRSDRAWHSSLTAREQEIAILVAQALSRTEIAAKLFLSVRTVDVHLGRVYRKLGVNTQVALAKLVNGSDTGSRGEGNPIG